MTGLIADIGGTNARFAIVEPGGAITGQMRLACRDYPTVIDAVEAYLSRSEVRSRPRAAAIAVASPITGDDVRMTNHVWSFSIEDTRRQLHLDNLDVVNDFVAIALGVTRLAAEDLVKIGAGEPVAHATIGVLGPGTGLGMAAMVPSGLGWIPLNSEGGHVTMPACNEREFAVLSLIRARYGHASAERVISGPGLVNMVQALAELDGAPVDAGLTPPDCTQRALDGSCRLSMEALDLFCRMLGVVAGNLALTLNARGGVYIAGGIVPQLGRAFYQSDFRACFEDKGRFGAFLATVPTYAITHPHPAFAGLAALVSGR
jgi:glucokinase